jgi:hypothetical protein
MPSYYHVLVSRKNEPDTLECIYKDLDEAALQRQFVRPFKKGKDLNVSGNIYRSSEIAKAKIMRTDFPAAAELAKLKADFQRTSDRLNREPGSYVFLPPVDTKAAICSTLAKMSPARFCHQYSDKRVLSTS